MHTLEPEPRIIRINTLLKAAIPVFLFILAFGYEVEAKVLPERPMT